MIESDRMQRANRILNKAVVTSHDTLLQKPFPTFFPKNVRT